MKKLILLLLLPIFSYSQEALIAIKIQGIWNMQVNIISIANVVKPQGSIFSYDTSFIDTGMHSIQLGDWSGSVKKTDRILYNIVGDTMYTQVDMYTQVYLLVCESNDCCMSCKKTVQGTCNCELPACERGKCDERTYGISNIPSIGMSNAIRSYLN